MGNLSRSFVRKTAKTAIMALPTATVIAVFSSTVHGNTEECNCDENVMPLYVVQVDGEPGWRHRYKFKKVNKAPQNLSVSKDFKFYEQVASLDLTDPSQAETLLQFMDIRLGEKQLKEDVVLVADSDTVEKASEAPVQNSVYRDKLLAAEQPGLRERRAKDMGPGAEYQVGTVAPQATTPKATNKAMSEEDKEREREQARIARAMERRQARLERQKAEEDRKAKEKALAARERERAWEEPRRRQEENRNGVRQNLEGAPVQPRGQGEGVGYRGQQGAQIPVRSKQPANALLSRPLAPPMTTVEDPRIINFDQGITRRFRNAGSYLDKGDSGNNIVTDSQGREFLNVIAFWDVLVEPQSNGENYYHGSIQFPMGSRHPAIIKSTLPGDEIDLGCKSNEVVVLKSFETEGIDYTHGLVDAYLAHSLVMPDGTVAFQEDVRQPSFGLINAETGCLPRDMFSRSQVDPQRMGGDKILYSLPVRK